MNRLNLRSRALPSLATVAGAALLAVLPPLCPVAHAATVSFTATNLADTTPGEDLWQYQYSVSNLALNPGQGFSIFFDLNLYSQLQSSPPSLNTGWDLLAIQPDLALASNGFFDALVLQAAPSLANPFTLTFVWLGTGAPGSQPFTIYDANFSTIAEGQTNPVPASLQFVPMGPGSTLLVWTPASAVLERSSDLVTWTPVTGAVSPLTLTFSNLPPGARFYRLSPGP